MSMQSKEYSARRVTPETVVLVICTGNLRGFWPDFSSGVEFGSFTLVFMFTCRPHAGSPLSNNLITASSGSRSVKSAAIQCNFALSLLSAQAVAYSALSADRQLRSQKARSKSSHHLTMAAGVRSCSSSNIFLTRPGFYLRSRSWLQPANAIARTKNISRCIRLYSSPVSARSVS